MINMIIRNRTTKTLKASMLNNFKLQSLNFKLPIHRAENCSAMIPLIISRL